MNGFKIIGIEVRTTNQQNKSQQDLSNLWNRFYSDNIIDKIPNKEGLDILSIYTDYQTDYKEDYTTIIGMKVSTLEQIPEGLIGRSFKTESFTKFTAKGLMPDAVISTWMDIWKQDALLKRKYTYDFEVYTKKSQQGAESEVEIFIAI